MRSSSRSVAAALLAGVALAVAPAANAQAPSPAPGASEKSANIPDQKVDAAAAAAMRVASLKQDYRQRLASAEAGEKERIVNEAGEAMAKAVTEQGLSIEEYTLILTTAENDPDLRKRIMKRIAPDED
jgi:hypothetical protein